MPNDQISRRHHYLPEFILKGFACDDGRLFVYDKDTRRFWKDPAFPKQIFWRHNQNTFTIGNEETDFVEQIYSKMDNDFSPIYANLVEMPGPVTMSVEDMAQLISFVALSFYRVPVNDEVIKSYVEQNPPQKLGFKLFNPKTNEDADPEVYKIVMGQPAFIESYRISKPILELMQYRKNVKVDDWRIAAPATLKGFGLIGDNPVILKNEYRGSFVAQEMIMPLSKHHIVYHNKGKKPDTLPPEHKFTVDLFQFLQAGRYVCGSDKSYIQRIVDFTLKPGFERVISALKAELFSVFSERST